MLREGRLDPLVFNLPVEKMRAGYYSDTYFNRAREIMARDGNHTKVRMQVFARNHSVLCGIDEALAIVRLCSGRTDPASQAWQEGWPALDVRALHDGDEIAPYETVMTIAGESNSENRVRRCVGIRRGWLFYRRCVEVKNGFDEADPDGFH